ncbi:MmgE/PrpD family protein [Paraburkholderia phytofirmans]|jgi:hypothetical protein|uniref:MmgE/PrpD family protein n=1 Tax=Paraburkholderia sp. BL9I2N2 TaxID=1938809 RepID=UPI0010435658|nr:MmgE/PrpD family protein [Paraburkholderia sp. BL9I2N2]TCK86954.1 MmgE/PrpD family protein [Paraburkholderia sp. BL9I2N2]
MHNAAQHSVVSDALVGFAIAALPASADAALDAARDALTHARLITDPATRSTEQISALLQSQGSAATDSRTRAWILGTSLATQAAASPAMPVLAAVIVAGDTLGSSESDAIAAAAIGIEAAARILSAVDSAEFRVRWNVASSVGLLGAVLAVSRLLHLDEVHTRHALGVAATQAAGLAHNADHAMEAIEIGKAAADALEAAMIAKHGFTSAAASIDGRRGFAALMAYRFDTAAITEALGTRWTSVD